MHACEHVAVRAVAAAAAVVWCLMRCALSDSCCGCVCRRSPHRFELVLQDPQVIGMRRTAQVLMGRALQLLGDGRDVKAALWSALAALAAESNVISLAQLQKADSQTTASIIGALGEDAVFREVGGWVGGYNRR